MNTNRLLSLLLLTFLLIFSGCKKEGLTVTDVEGNTYKTFSIGGKVWMAESLRTTKFRDGSSIPLVAAGNAWSLTTTAAYNNVNNSSDNAPVYGRLYNWYAVTDSRNLCPEGWHVPSNDEYINLITALGGASVAGGKMKETGTDHWNEPNSGASNQSGFTGRGAGYISYAGVFKDFKYITGFWTSTQNTSGTAYHVGLLFDLPDADNYAVDKKTGLQVRCVKD
ncbi:MAG: hypothetical protein GYA43_10835 [Bacteroidales bacterium]|nr:hypothetical protein [Bacteroidales bacterium]